MTKPRTPRTWSEATHRIADRLGYDRAAAVVERSESLIRAWADPASGKRPSLEQALKLSAAYQADGGEEAPFLDAFAFQLDIRMDRQEACGRSLAADIAATAKEFGDAVAAAMTLVKSNASAREAHHAFVQVEELERAADALLRRVASFLPSHVARDAERTGGPDL